MSQAGIISESTAVGADIKTITGDFGGAVGADGAFNVDIVGTAAQGLVFTGTPASNVITGTVYSASTVSRGVCSFNDDDFTVAGGASSLADTVVKQVTTDTGMLTPSGHGFSINGIGGTSVTHAATVITIAVQDASDTDKGLASFLDADFDVAAGAVSLEDTVVKTVTTDSGVLTPVTHSFSILGGAGMDVTHAANVITVAGETATAGNPGIVELATDAEAQLLADTGRVLTPANVGAVFAPQKNSGFQEWTGAGSYYTINTQDFVLDRGGIGWINNVQITWAGAQTEAALGKGLTHFIYIDDTGTIGSTTTRSTALFQDNIVLFQVLVDNDTPANVVVVKENHSMMINPQVMEFCHDIGLHGFNVTEEGDGGVITLHGTVGVQVVGNTEWLDHDLETDVPDSAAAAITMNIMYTDAGGKWVQDAVQATVPTEYNNAGTPTALGGNQRAISCIYVSKDDIESAAPQYFLVMGDVVYASLQTANAALALNLFTVPTNELAALEMILMGHVIINATTIDSVTSDKQTIGVGTSSSSGNSANLISVDTTDFDGMLSATDTTVQVALETIDDFGKIGDFVTSSSSPVYYGTIFDTNVAAAGVTLTGTTLAADGTDVNINIVLEPKAGVVLADLTDAETATQPSVFIVRHGTSGTAANDFGVGMEFQHEVSGGTYAQGAKIYTKGTTAGADTAHTSLIFQTNNDAGLADRVTIDPSGLVNFTAGVSFGDETLSTYDEGTFTPTIAASGTAYTSIGYASQYGLYVKIGKIVHFQIQIVVNALTAGAASGDIEVQNLPFASFNTGGSNTPCTLACDNVNFDASPPASICGIVLPNSTVLRIQESNDNSGGTITAATGLTATSVIKIGGTYVTAS